MMIANVGNEGIKVKMLGMTKDPIRALWVAYRTCYSSRLSPAELHADGLDRQEEMERFVQERLKTGHTSPLEQVVFEFSIAGVSRAFSHQLVRHRLGTAFEQQSQRYVTYAGEFPYTIPATVASAGQGPAMARHFADAARLYEEMVQAGVPAEDARFLLPNATNTNLRMTINFASLLHLADIRLCTRAQWEFRKVVSLMRAEVLRAVPMLGKMLQPKCGERRMGFCDEDYKAYQDCVISASRPHKQDLAAMRNKRHEPVRGLSDEQFEAIESAT